MSKHKILVTGSAGFIGHHVVIRLTQEGHEVVGVDSLNHYYDVSLKLGRLKVQGVDTAQIEANKPIVAGDNTTFIQLDLSNEEEVAGLFGIHEFSHIIHLAAQPGVRYSLEAPRKYTKSNIDGTLNILEGARSQKIRHLVMASSSSVYGMNRKIPFEEKDPVAHPVSLYAATKRANELMAHTYAHLFNIPVTALRLFTVYGPWGRPDMAIFKFTRSIFEGKPIEVYNKGEMTRDFTYVRDAVAGITGVLDIPPAGNKEFDLADPLPDESSAPYRICNVGGSSPVVLNRFIEAIENKIGKKAQRIDLPMQPGDVLDTFASAQKLMDLGVGTPSTGLEDGISEFVDWYKSYYNIT